MGSNYEVWSYLFAGLSVLRGLALLAGLIICIRFRFLSNWMYLVLLGFVGWGASAGFSAAYPFVMHWMGGGGVDALWGLNAIVHLGSFVATIAVVVGMGFTLGDLSRRIGQLRELAQEREDARTGAGAR